MRRFARHAIFAILLPLSTVAAQQPLSPQLPGQSTHSIYDPLAPFAVSPLAQPATSAGVLFLYDLEHRFAASVAAGGGKAFATWFADDAVTLNNGRPAVLGRGNIAASATWDPTNL